MLIAGSFREYPFSLLLEIFLRRKETGLLEVSSTDEAGYFYIKNGKVKDGQIGKSKGLAALKLVGKFNEGSFRFKPLEPADYARIVWQRNFGPTGPAISRPAFSRVSIADKLGQLGVNAEAINRVLNDLRSLAHVALQQFFFYTPIAYHGLQRIDLYLQRRIVAVVLAALEFWRRVRIGTRLRRISIRASTALSQAKRRRERQVKCRYPRKVTFQVPTIASETTITSALQQRLEHNVVFVLTMAILLGASGLLLYQLVSENQEAMDTGITVNEHLDTPADATPSRPKPSRQHRKRLSVNKRFVNKSKR